MLSAAILSIIVLLTLVFSTTKYISSTSKPRPAVSYKALSPEENLLTFAKKVLKPKYIPEELSLKKIVRNKNLLWYRQEINFDKNTVIVFHYDEGVDDKKEHTKFIEIMENQHHENANLDTVLSVFNKYLIMPKVDKSEWERTDYGKNFIVYQLVWDNPDRSFDGRTSAIVTNEKGEVSIRIDACHVTTANNDWDKHTCVGQ